MGIDLLDKLDGFLDAFGVPKEGQSKIENAEEKIDSIRKTARFISVISDPEEREKVAIEALRQAYQAGVESKK